MKYAVLILFAGAAFGQQYEIGGRTSGTAFTGTAPFFPLPKPCRRAFATASRRVL